ncbi:DUF2141 domain-containing protein [Hyphomonas pacifica]|uniref:Uncharacterized protein n=1 Tax=Hyphomonas pacifica TaxID=1280941 RepID=A0A062TY93_9PROT|nr:DUF2141 domain-containing protein [Hyphomonas pacifica]KCZ53026.1 hypothetical protein HY2_00445 [Hyphomonas pacifica]RAN36115.1 hypothetical protein HY3_00625 [Hyphomonas pacifica]
MIRNTLISALFVSCLLPETAAAADLSVDIKGIRKAEGQLHVALFEEAGWGDNQAAQTKVIPSTGDDVTFVFEGLQPGRYGIKMFHDVDGDGELKRSMIGIPVEPYGFSNDAPVRFGPPDFDTAAFEVTEDGAVQTITLR